MRGASPLTSIHGGQGEGNPSSWNINSSPDLISTPIESPFESCIFLKKSGVKTTVLSKQVTLFWFWMFRRNKRIDRAMGECGGVWSGVRSRTCCQRMEQCVRGRGERREGVLRQRLTEHCTPKQLP